MHDADAVNLCAAMQRHRCSCSKVAAGGRDLLSPAACRHSIAMPDTLGSVTDPSHTCFCAGSNWHCKSIRSQQTFECADLEVKVTSRPSSRCLLWCVMACMHMCAQHCCVSKGWFHKHAVCISTSLLSKPLFLLCGMASSTSRARVLSSKPYQVLAERKLTAQGIGVLSNLGRSAGAGQTGNLDTGGFSNDDEAAHVRQP